MKKPSIRSKRCGMLQASVTAAIITVMVGVHVDAKAETAETQKINEGIGFLQEWQPARLDDAAFQQRKEALAAQVDLPSLERDPMPAQGLLVTNIVPRGQAAKAGLREGYVITHINDEPCWNSDSPWPAGPRVLKWIDSRGGQHEYDMKSGSIGVGHVTYRRPELWYLRDGNRNEKWDAFVVAAMASRETDPVLAREAWARAIEAGYPLDDVARAGLTESVARGHKPALAARLIQDLPEAAPGRPALIYPEQRTRIMLAGGLFDLMHGKPQPLNRFAASEQAVLGTRPALKRPKSFAGELPNHQRLDIKPSLKPANFGFFNVSRRSLGEALLADKPFGLASAPGQFEEAIARRDEPIGDFEYLIEFSARPTGRPVQQWASQFTFAVYDADQQIQDDVWQGADTVLGATVSHFQPWDRYAMPLLGVHFASIKADFGWTEALLALDGKTEHTLRLVRLGDRGAVYFNDVRMLLTPLDPQVTNLAFHIHTVGLNVRVKRYEIHELQARDGALAE